MNSSLVRRYQVILAGCLCIWLLGLLHSTTELFRLEEEDRMLGLGNVPSNFQFRKLHKSGSKGRTFLQPSPSSKLSKNDYNNKNNESLVLVLHKNGSSSFLPKSNATLLKHKKPPKLLKPKKRKKSNWWPFAASVNLDLPKPVIVMGFPKAGTSSIFSFFDTQGLKSQHWYCCKPQHDPQEGGPSLMAGCLMKNLRHNATNLFEKCGNSIEVFSEINGPRRRVMDRDSHLEGNLMDDGSIDITIGGPRIFFPQHFHIDKIHQAFPNATWILNHRPVDDWIESVMEWGDHLDKQFANEYYAQKAIPKLPSNQTSMKDFLKTIYEDHMDMIRNFVKEHPTHALVEVTITDDDAGTVLGDAFGLDEKFWNHRNKNQKGTFQYYARHHMPKFHFTGSAIWWTMVLLVTAYLGTTVGLLQWQW